MVEKELALLEALKAQDWDTVWDLARDKQTVLNLLDIYRDARARARNDTGDRE